MEFHETGENFRDNLIAKFCLTWKISAVKSVQATFSVENEPKDGRIVLLLLSFAHTAALLRYNLSSNFKEIDRNGAALNAITIEESLQILDTHFVASEWKSLGKINEYSSPWSAIQFQ